MKILSPLRDRDFALLWSGLTISLIGDGIYLVAVAWQAYAISNTPSALAIVGLAWSIGLTVFLLTGGVVSDRWDRRRVMIAADIVRAGALTVLGVLAITDVLEIWHMVVLVFVYASGEAFFGPALGALIPDVLRDEQLVQASAFEQFARHLCKRLIGPAIGGLLVALVGAGTSFLLDAGTFLVSALAISLMRTRSRIARTDNTTVLGDMKSGLKYVRGHRWLWVTFTVSSIAMLLFFGPAEVLLPYVVRNDLNAGAGSYGLVLASDGAGSILAAILIARRDLPRHYLTLLFACWGAGTLPLVGYAVAAHLWQLMILAACFGALITIGIVVFVTVQNSRVPAAMRGRIRSVDLFTSIGLAPLSFALTGPATAWLGVQTTLILAGLAPALLNLVMFLAFRMRREEVPIPGVTTPALDEPQIEPVREVATLPGDR